MALHYTPSSFAGQTVVHPKEDGLWEWERYDRVPVDAA